MPRPLDPALRRETSASRANISPQMGGTRPEDAHDLFLHLGNDRHRSLPRVYVARFAFHLAWNRPPIPSNGARDGRLRHQVWPRVKSVTPRRSFLNDSALLAIASVQLSIFDNVNYEAECSSPNQVLQRQRNDNDSLLEEEGGRDASNCLLIARS